MFDPSKPQDSYNHFGFETLCNLPKIVAKSAFLDSFTNGLTKYYSFVIVFSPLFITNIEHIK